MKKNISLFVIFVGFTLNIKSVMSDELLVVALGDSYTAGTLADTVLTPPPRNTTRGIQTNSNAFRDGLLQLIRTPSLSWSTGNKISSHYMKLLDSHRQSGDQTPLKGWNLSVPGARAIDIEKQIKTLSDYLEKNQDSRISYLTLLIGNNDICSTEASKPDFIQKTTKKIQSILTKLSELPHHQNEKIKVLFPGIVNIAALGKREIQRTKTMFFNLSCRDLHRLALHYCDRLTVWNTPDEYEKKKAEVQKYNDLIQTQIFGWGTRYPQLDLVYSDALFYLDPMPWDLAVDCFHPNAYSQMKTSDALWHDVPWFR